MKKIQKLYKKFLGGYKLLERRFLRSLFAFYLQFCKKLSKKKAALLKLLGKWLLKLQKPCLKLKKRVFLCVHDRVDKGRLFFGELVSELVIELLGQKEKIATRLSVYYNPARLMVVKLLGMGKLVLWLWGAVYLGFLKLKKPCLKVQKIILRKLSEQKSKVFAKLLGYCGRAKAVLINLFEKEKIKAFRALTREFSKLRKPCFKLQKIAVKKALKQKEKTVAQLLKYYQLFLRELLGQKEKIVSKLVECERWCKTVERIEIPLFFDLFGWQPRFSLVKIRKRVLWPFKTYWQQAIATILIISLIGSNFFFLQPEKTYAAIFYWEQTDWATGPDTENFPNHTSNREGWAKFYSSSNINYSVSGEITMENTTLSWTETSATHFNAGSHSDTVVSGSGDDATIILDPPLEPEQVEQQNRDVQLARAGREKNEENKKGEDSQNNQYLNILTPKSNPVKGSIWEVKFETRGRGDLIIQAGENTDFEEELQFLGVWCGDSEVSGLGLTSDKIVVEGWQCDKEAKIQNKVLDAGTHHLIFNFLGEKDTASNFACDSGDLDTTCNVSTQQTMTNGSTISGAGNLVIQSGGDLTCSATNAFSISMTGDVTVQSGGTITCNLTSLTAANATIDDGGTINVSEKGSAGGTGDGSGSGTGGGTGNNNGTGGGGGYGGDGGIGDGAGGIGYGSLAQPTDLGSGGGGSNRLYVGSATGGSGGGKVKIDVTTILTVNGSITANGGNGACAGSRYGSGGGSGGSIWLIAGILTGSGTVTANGGNGGGCPYNGGSGGGGRITIQYTTDSSTLSTLSAYGGTVGNQGGAGTLFKKAASATNGDLTVDNGTVNGANTTQTASTTWTVDNVTFKNYGYYVIPSGATFNVVDSFSNSTTDSALTVTGTLGLPSSSFAPDFGLYQNATISGLTDLTIASGATYYYQSGTISSLSLTVAGTGTAEFQNLNSSTSVTLANLTIQNGGTVTHSQNYTSETYILNLVVTNNLSIESGGSINVNSKGFQPGTGCCGALGYGTGKGQANGCAYWSGASYGGSGGTVTSCGTVGPGPTYGSETQPVNIGSSAGGSGYGGGAIKLDVTNTLSVYGSITADGGNNGGSGGSIWIMTGTLDGSGGTITANGGNGSGSSAGAGGGGRIAVYTKTDSSSLTITVNAGSGGPSGATAGTTSTGATYLTSGNFTSQSYDFGFLVDPTTITWNASTSGNTTVKFQISSSADNVDWTDYLGSDGTTGTYYESSGGTINAAHDNHRYFKYKLYLSTTDRTETPVLQDVTINAALYDANLISSPFDFGNAFSVFNDLSWTEDLPANTDLKFQLQTSPDNSSWTGWQGPDGTSDTYFTDPTGGENLPAGLSDGSNDRWVQYKAFFSTTDSSTATLSNIILTYTVNAPPAFNTDYPSEGAGGVSASQGTDTTVTIAYSIMDEDTNSGSVTQYYITPTFEYSLDGGSSYTSIDLANITFGAAPENGDVSDVNLDGDYDNKVLQDSYLIYTAVWDAEAEITVGSDTYETDAKVRVTIDDNELANRTANAASADFTLDTRNPAAGTPTGGGTGININQNALTSLDNDKTNTTSVTLYLSATDDSTFQMKIANDAAFTDVSYEDYSATKSWTLTSGDGTKTVYAKFKDQYGNETSAYSDTITLDAAAPAIPGNIGIQEVSNADAGDYRLFLAWGIISDPGDFAQYDVYYNTTSDPETYSLLTSITDRTTNYYVHTSLSNGTTYYYKLKSKDDIENLSSFSSIVNLTAGSNPSDSINPTISNVSYANLRSSSVTITFDTNETAVPCVGYSTSSGNFGTEVCSTSYGTSHSITLIGLSANTTYYYQAKATDPSTNTATDNNSGPGYTFGTTEGPKVSAGTVSVTKITATTATIVWQTDIVSDSYVIYSTSADLSGSSEGGQLDSATSHSVDLSSLSQGTKYYFYVRSRVSGNTGEDKNVSNGIINYYNFTTITDSTGPVISSISASRAETSAVITWTTDELSTSQVEYGLTDSYGSTTSEDTSLTLQHTVTLSSLSVATTYHYRVISVDADSNSTTSSDQNFTTRDNVAPVISAVTSGSLTLTGATITWTTNENSTSLVDFGTTTQLGSLAGQPDDSVTSHSVAITGLDNDTLYYYQVRSADSSGNSTTDNNSGDYYPFTTVADTTAPTISDIAEVVSDTSVSITWTTNELSTSQVEYGLTSSYGSSTSEDTTLTYEHAVSITSLTTNTTYHFKAESKDAANNLGTSSDQTFTTREASGGVAYLSYSTASSDTPIITGVTASEITQNSAKISWLTDRNANSVISYGKTTTYGSIAGNNQESVMIHSVRISSLDTNTTYHYQVTSYTPNGVAAVYSDKNFATLKEGEVAPAQTTQTTEVAVVAEQQESAAVLTEENNILNTVVSASQSFVSKILDKISFNPHLPEVNEKSFLSSVSEMASKIISSPVISGDYPKVETGSNWAKITWVTDKNSNSLVAYAKTANYNPTRDEPYKVIVGNPDEKVTSHEVEINNLEPSTEYHFQVRSSSVLGPVAKSSDKTFRTASLRLEISDITINKTSQSEVNVTWSTSIPATAQLVYANFQTGEIQKADEPNLLQDHVLALKELQAGVSYSLEINAKDGAENVVSSPILNFSTGKDVTPPQISQIIIEKALSSTQDKPQVIIFWVTDEPSTSQVFYSETAISAQVAQSTVKDTALVKKHIVVIPYFKSGAVYHFYVESQDASSNASRSDEHIILTPQRGETVFQIIFKNFQKNFNWVNKLRF